MDSSDRSNECIRCRKCRKKLLSTSLLEEYQESTSESGADDKIIVGILHINLSDSPPWIIECINEKYWRKGKIKCPRCFNNIGSFDFSSPRQYIGGGLYSLPSVSILSKKVDLVKKKHDREEKEARAQCEIRCIQKQNSCRDSGTLSSETNSLSLMENNDALVLSNPINSLSSLENPALHSLNVNSNLCSLENTCFPSSQTSSNLSFSSFQTNNHRSPRENTCFPSTQTSSNLSFSSFQTNNYRSPRENTCFPSTQTSSNLSLSSFQTNNNRSLRENHGLRSFQTYNISSLENTCVPSFETNSSLSSTINTGFVREFVEGTELSEATHGNTNTVQHTEDVQKRIASTTCILRRRKKDSLESSNEKYRRKTTKKLEKENIDKKERELDEEDMCTICFEVMYKPHVLFPCQHTYCVACLWKLSEFSRNENTLCPMCRTIIQHCSPDFAQDSFLKTKYGRLYKIRAMIVNKARYKNRRLPESKGLWFRPGMDVRDTEYPIRQTVSYIGIAVIFCVILVIVTEFHVHYNYNSYTVFLFFPVFFVFFYIVLILFYNS